MKRFVMVVLVLALAVVGLAKTLEEALITAVENGQVEHVKMLLELGADIDAAAPDGARVVYIALLSGNQELLAIFKDALAKEWPNRVDGNIVFTPPEVGIPAWMVLVEGGAFTMGNTRQDEEGDSDETVHEVLLGYDFLLGKTEVTFADYDAFCEETGKDLSDDAGFGREDRPAIYVSWFDAVEYCNWLSAKAGLPAAYDADGNLLDANGNITYDITMVKGYRLPTEAEWEYAARGGNQSEADYMFAGSDDLDQVGWYDDNSEWQSHEVALKKPNELGLYDMSGNVDEWCHDWYEGNYYDPDGQVNPIGPSDEYLERVARGGTWYDYYSYCRITFRYYYSPESGEDTLGFRVARTY